MNRNVLVLLFAVSATLLPRSVNAEITDLAGTAQGLFALDDSGGLWLHSGRCTQPGWTLVETIGNAVAFGWLNAQSSSVPTGVIVTSDGRLLLGRYTYGQWIVDLELSDVPISDVLRAGFVWSGSGGHYRIWIQSTTNALWSVDIDLTEHTWSGPCDGPPQPTALGSRSWGALKATFR